jgi:hypothetical protein
MSRPESLRALRRENPRSQPGFDANVDAYAQLVRGRITSASSPSLSKQRGSRRLVRISLAGGLAAAAVAVASLAVGSLGGAPGVESATAAVKRAATTTAASAEKSGMASVRITHGDDLWAVATVRWNGNDIAISRVTPQRPGKVGTAMLLVDGNLYGVDPEVDGGWVNFGSPSHIDPDSGTTPAEHLAAVREDVGGATLRRFSSGLTALTARHLDDGSTVYSGRVAAGLIARETGLREGQAIRVFPFGYVAHDEAADPAALLDVAVAVGPDDLVRSIVVTWGTGTSAWNFTVAYSGLGATAAPVAPANATSIRELRGLVQPKPAP